MPLPCFRARQQRSMKLSGQKSLSFYWVGQTCWFAQILPMVGGCFVGIVAAQQRRPTILSF
jgi:hypothetical protein